MIGIYQDSFLDLLKSYLGEPIKITSKNIICRCPWCEYGLEKDHYHCYISLESPIFNCFHAECSAHGALPKLIKKLKGSSLKLDQFFDSKTLSEYKSKRYQSLNVDEYKLESDKDHKIIIPKSNSSSKYKYKLNYLMSRLKYVPLSYRSMKNVIFSVHDFLYQNKIKISDKTLSMIHFLDQNFVGFLTENKTTLILRNIDKKSDFRYFKIPLVENKPHFIDYYLIRNTKLKETIRPTIVICEGIFDALNEFYFNTTKIRDVVDFYAASLSLKSFPSLIKSLAFNEEIFRSNVIVLSDRNVSLNFYKNLKKNCSHLISNITVYYNRLGKDFGDTPCIPEKFVI